MLLMVGLRVQKPVRRVKRSRSIFYTVVCKCLARPGKRRKSGKRKSGKRKYMRTTKKVTYSRR